jgi:hypothetical protein
MVYSVNELIKTVFNNKNVLKKLLRPIATAFFIIYLNRFSLGGSARIRTWNNRLMGAGL